MIYKKEKQIKSIEDWEIYAGPKENKQWKDHRSAKESANAWFRNSTPALPIELKKIILSNNHFDDVKIQRVEPEAALSFDQYSGPAMMDVLIHASDSIGNYVVGVEAKADEPFGNQYMRDATISALETKIENANSKKLNRIEELCLSLFKTKSSKESEIGDLRYQLITGLAGIIAKANKQNFGRAIFLIHEFVTSLTKGEKLAVNQNDLKNFINRITGGQINQIEAGNLYGPISITGKPLFEKQPQIFIGKVSITVE